MYYQNYEDYMRSVLGYGNSELNYTYDDNYYYPRVEELNVDNSELESMYPDVYRIINPTVEDVCSRNRDKQMTEDLLKSMVDEVYTTIEKNPSINIDVQVRTELKNGDVRNPNAKETRQRNFLLSDLIRILILRNLIGNRPPRPPMRPPMRPPYPGPRPPMRPPYPGGPGPRV